MTRLTKLLAVLFLAAITLPNTACGRSDLLSYAGSYASDGGPGRDALADGKSPNADSGPPTRCTSSEDCGLTPATPYCELPEGVCVACLTMPDTCPNGEACDPTSHQCEPIQGCTSDATCPTTKPHCRLETHTCVGCIDSAQCPPADVCQNFECVGFCGNGAACGEGQSCCSPACVDEGTDPENCGSCGRRCANGEACVGGACQPDTNCQTVGCTGTDTCCGNTCVNTEVSRDHCGNCINECALGETCSQATCQASGTCNDGPACTDTEQCCEAGCTDTTSDPNNCMFCGNVCPAGSTCQASVCIPPSTMCNGGPVCTGLEQCCASGCTNTQTDPNNCSQCGFQCANDDTCVAGNCQPPASCNGGPMCTGVEQCCATGCSDIDTDPKNCGTCNAPCAVGDTCVAGVCTPPPSCNGAPVCTGTDKCCATGCSDTTTDPKNCGSCGNPCALGDTCVASVCTVPTSCNGGPACTGGETCCTNGCFNTTNDVNNCGGCGNICTAGDTCIDGACASNEGVFSPTVNPTYLSPGVHSYTSINVPAGVTVYVAGAGANSGTLDLNATGAIIIDGTIDVSGGPGTQNTITSESTQAGRAGGGGFTGEPYQSAVGSAACSFVGGNGGSLGDGVTGTTGSCTVASTTACINEMDPSALLFTSPVATYGGGGGVFTGYRAYGAGGGGPAGGAPGALGAAYPGEADCSGVSGGGGAIGGAGGAGTSSYAGTAGRLGQTQCAGVQAGVPAAYVGGGGGGAIGSAATSDLAVTSTFQTGSAGGGGSADYLNRPVFGGTSGGGGGGGAIKLSSATSISIQGAVLANGGLGGDAVIGIGSDANCDPQPGAAGGGGSGGLIYLSAPTISVASGAEVSAAGGAGGAQSEFATGGAGGNGGLGRIRLSVTAPSCTTLQGSFAPALPAGCAAGPAKAGIAYVGTYPN